MARDNAKLAQIEEYAGLFLTPEEIAVLIDVPLEKFSEGIADKKSPIYKAYFKGKTKSKMEIRKNIILLAKNGSPQAEIMAGKFMTDQDIAETEI